ncbi:hypothetical protein [Vermiculatibacterium agrestimuris]|uniref:hypothetical protein n=1 Tax=Vermiculatibacterium agrestimuris TaxID=2941519 RepID=UPI0020416FAE|nr:hypothetical protein [Vermiculatibacterium agrestimuris]
MKGLEKYKTSLIGMGCLIGGDILALILYLCCLYAQGNGGGGVALEIIANILIVLISVLSTSIISVPLIEVRGKNTLCQQLLTGDVLRTPQLFDSLTDEQKGDVLQTLESAVYFDSDPAKGDMYASIRRKINNQSLKADYYFTSCEYSVRCSVEGDFIRKTILKKTSILSYKPMTLSDFPLCITSFPEIENQDFLQVSLLKVNGRDCSLEDDIRSEKTKLTDPLPKKSGYTATMKHLYARTLSLTPTKPAVVEVEYTTVVPKNDKSYICRVSAPCRKFKFHFDMDGENKDQYRVALSAFGFIDDGNSSFNHHDDAPSASIELNDWIFTQDGVAVTILEKSLVPAGVQ